MPATLPLHDVLSPGTSRASLSARALSTAASALANLWHEYRLRRDRRLLEGFGERELSDIGIGRGQIDGAVRHGRPRLPTATDARWPLWRGA